ncbi:MAG: 50S ribosomal protein L24 [Candidatus Nanoarchaeia archaeon]
MALNNFSKHWKSSTQTRKQRKYRHNAPNHLRHKMMRAPLSSDLRKQHGVRNMSVRSGDTVVVKAGQFKGQSGKIAIVNLAKLKIKIDGVQQTKRDGSSVMYPIDPSNVEITKLDLSDDLRKSKLDERVAQIKQANEVKQ